MILCSFSGLLCEKPVYQILGIAPLTAGSSSFIAKDVKLFKPLEKKVVTIVFSRKRSCVVLHKDDASPLETVVYALDVFRLIRRCP